MTQAMGDTNRVVLQESPKKNNPLTFYLRSLFYALMAGLLRVVCLAPLGALLAFPQGSPWRWLALLTPALLVFFILPLRFSFAQALVQRRRQRYFSFDTALSASQYGEKLAESLLHAMNVLKWGVPFLAMVAGMWFYRQQTDVLSLLDEVTAFGKWGAGAYCAVINFFAHLFGNGAFNLAIAGGVVEGVYALLGVLGLLALVWLLGAVRNSATRYIWVAADRADQNPRTETRRRLRGRRLRQLGVALVNLVLWAPTFLGLYAAFGDVLTSLSQINLLLIQQQLSAIDLWPVVGPLAFTFFALYLPLLPIRRYLTAAFASRAPRHAAPGMGDPKEPRADRKHTVVSSVAPTLPPAPAEEPRPVAAVPAPTLNQGQPYDPQALNAPYAPAPEQPTSGMPLDL